MKAYYFDEAEAEFLRLLLDGTIQISWLDDEEFIVYNSLREKFNLPKISPYFLTDRNFE